VRAYAVAAKYSRCGTYSAYAGLTGEGRTRGCSMMGITMVERTAWFPRLLVLLSWLLFAFVWTQFSRHDRRDVNTLLFVPLVRAPAAAYSVYVCMCATYMYIVIPRLPASGPIRFAVP
jgi:hypothetical protein